MQSKTSFFNKTVFRKDLTRFAPVWGLYTVGMVLCLVLSALNNADSYDNFYIVRAFAELANGMAIVNCGYALVIAQALFGDLYNSRSCYALHAMPVRRETWYFTHILSGILFSLVPTLIAALCAIPMVMNSCVVNGWAIPLLTFAAVNLQYICFFGIAVACTFCAGNRLGMLMLYGMANCAAVVLGMLVEASYLDFLFGVRIASARYQRFSPMIHMIYLNTVKFDDFWALRRVWEQDGMGYDLLVNFTLEPKTWTYLAICAIVGLVLLVLSLFLYKRRKLECAGDFLAFKKLGTVFQAVFAFGVGALFQLVYVGYASQDNNGYFIFMGIGLTLGWFGGRMLLDRTTRVFRKKSLAGLAAVALAVAVSFGLTWLDPMGFGDWVPQADEVESIWFGGWTFGDQELTSREDIENMIYLHQMALEEHLDMKDITVLRPEAVERGVTEETAAEADIRYTCDIELRYMMKDGSTPIRHYTVWVDSELGQMVKGYASSPEVILRRRYDDFDLEKAKMVWVNGTPLKDVSSPEDIKSLYAALMADCEEGNMAGGSIFHKGYFDFGERDEYGEYYGRYGTSTAMDIQIDGEPYSLYLSVWADSNHTLKWLEERGILEQLHVTVVPNACPPHNVG